MACCESCGFGGKIGCGSFLGVRVPKTGVSGGLVSGVSDGVVVSMIGARDCCRSVVG
jgi:hypothetical protein